MVVDAAWIAHNLGFDPMKKPAPANTYSYQKAATSHAPEDLAREIIDFDSEAPEGEAFFEVSTATGLSKFTNIPWPAGLAPQTAATAGGAAGGPLPKADVLVVTWTVDEGHATSRVLTPGKDSRNDYLAYTHNFATLSRDFVKESPAIELGRLGTYWSTMINGKSVVVFKSDSHLSQDGPFGAQPAGLEADYRGGRAEAGADDGHGRRHRRAVRGRGCDREPGRALRLHQEVQGEVRR